jgi:hypothetical protein
VSDKDEFSSGLILPWNLKDEIMEQMACIREWGGKFVVPIPKIEIV